MIEIDFDKILDDLRNQRIDVRQRLVVLFVKMSLFKMLFFLFSFLLSFMAAKPILDRSGDLSGKSTEQLL
jgi:hypothetical protein